MTLSEKRTLCECLGSLLKTKVYCSQVYDAGKYIKGESIDLHEIILKKKFWKKQGKEFKRSTVPGEVDPL